MHDEVIEERCDECGFDGSIRTDEAALDQLAQLPDRWAASIDGLSPPDLLRRPRSDRWSIAEYTDHVRETVFGMRFVLDIAVAEPGADLGEPTTPRFDAQPRPIDAEEALVAFRREIELLVDRLRELDSRQWSSTVVIGDDLVDVPWILRHAVHDVSHHLGDVAALRSAL